MRFVLSQDGAQAARRERAPVGRREQGVSEHADVEASLAQRADSTQAFSPKSVGYDRFLHNNFPWSEFTIRRMVRNRQQILVSLTVAIGIEGRVVSGYPQFFQTRYFERAVTANTGEVAGEPVTEDHHMRRDDVLEPDAASPGFNPVGQRSAGDDEPVAQALVMTDFRKSLRTNQVG